MKKTNMRMISCMCAVLLASSGILASCGDTETGIPSDTHTNDTETAVQTEETEEDLGRLNARDSLPAKLDFGGREIRVLARDGDYETGIEFIAETENADIVNDAVYARNRSVEERLGIDINVIPVHVTRHESATDEIRNSVSSGSDDYDVIANHLGYTIPLTLEGMFLDLNELDYLDFSKPWWNQTFLRMSEYEGRNYTAIGELSQTMISGSYCMFFNKEMFKEFYPDDPSLYETVNNGQWTMDKLISYCKPLYQDLNGNGEADDGDRYGNFFSTNYSLATDAFVGGCGVEFLTKDKNGDVTFTGGGERMAAFMEKMIALIYENNNSCRNGNNDDTMLKTLADGTTMFTSWTLSGINGLRDMKQDFGIIPMPKLDESQDAYMPYTHDGSTCFLVPVTCNEPDPGAAFLEAMSAETYRTVTPAYFETAVKQKYSRDEETCQMLDLIVSSVYMDINFIYGQSLTYPIAKMRIAIVNKASCETITSTMASIEQSVLACWDRIQEQYAKINS